MEQKNVGIIGFGRFGQLWAKMLAQKHQVLVTDTVDLSHIATKLKISFYHDLAKMCAEVEAIFLCVPISKIEAVVKLLKPHLKAGTVVFDTCSVKSYPATILQKHLEPLPVELIATHPMFGPDSGAKGLQGLPLVIWPLSEAKTAYPHWKAYFEDLGLSVVEISPNEHDRLAANSQGITHYIGRVLGEMNLEPTVIDTTGFKSLLAVVHQTCNDTWQLFHDLQHYNPYTKAMRLQLEIALEQIYGSLLPKPLPPNALVVGVQGKQGDLSEVACRDYCKKNQFSTYNLHYFDGPLNILTALHAGDIDRGVLIIQNANGVVLETLEALSRYNCHILAYFEDESGHTFAWIQWRKENVEIRR